MTRRIWSGNKLIFMTIALAAALTPLAGATYTLNVNAGVRQGSWSRFYERAVATCHMNTVISSCYGRNISRALKKGHDEAGFQYMRGHGILNEDVNVYTEVNGVATYNWTNFDKIFDSVKAAGMRPVVEIGFMPPALASATTKISGVWYNGVGGNWNAPKDWAKWEALMRALVAHCKSRYGVEEVRNNWFFELWNEPNWMYGGGGGYTGWKTLYQHTAAAIRAEDPLIKLGGPAESGGSSNSAVPDFMSWVRTNNIKADFCSYHIYANDAGTDRNCNTAEPIRFHRDVITAAAKANNFSGLLVNTEWGPSYSAGVILAHDGEHAASFAAKAIHLFNLADTVACPPPYMLAWWALSDIYEEIDNRNASPAFCGCYGLLCRGVDSIPRSWDVAKPSFNVYKLLHRLKNYKISSSGGTLSSPGVNVIGTISAGNDTISIMVYSHVDNTTGNSATQDNVTLNITLPAGWTNVKAEHWMVDRTRSNSYQAWVSLGSPVHPSAAQWATIADAAELAHYDSVRTTSVTGGVWNKSYLQNHYSVGLVELTRASTRALEQSHSRSAGSRLMVARLDKNRIVVTSSFEGQHNVRLYSIDGRAVRSLQLHGQGTIAIPTGDMSRGAYLLEFTDGTRKEVREFVSGRGN